MSRAKKFLRQATVLEDLLEENFNATGADLEEKTRAAASELPKGILDKLAFLAKLQREAQRGEEISAADFRQAGYWINAARPYLRDYAETRKNRWVVPIFWLVAISVLAFLVFKFLPTWLEAF